MRIKIRSSSILALATKLEMKRYRRRKWMFIKIQIFREKFCPWFYPIMRFVIES